MQQDKLWAPWRMEYILSEKPKECFLCQYPQENNDQKRLILYRGDETFIIMNYYPYNNGHLLIAPYQHTNQLSDLSDAAKLEMMKLMEVSIDILGKAMRAQGFNTGLNFGQVGGAGVKDHLHMHVVPRWNGDTNFMPIIGHTKVISEGLEETWAKLHKYYQKL
ncbi:MAG: HIT family protein [Fidelibacterota bacterium]